MARMKTFFKYFLAFVFLYLFVSVMTYLNVKAAVSNMEIVGIDFSNPAVTIEDAKSSRVNAFVNGKIKADPEQPIGFRYIRVDFLSERGNALNNKYIDLEGMQPGEEREFSINTNTENIKKVNLVLTDIKETGGFDASFQEFSKMLITVVLVYALIF